MPLLVAKLTVTCWPETADNETANVALEVPALPSATVTSSIDSDGAGSLSAIVTTAVPSPIVAPPGADSVTLKVSASSSSVSSSVAMAIVCVVTPGANVIVLLAAV